MEASRVCVGLSISTAKFPNSLRAHLVEELLGVGELVLPGVHLCAVEPELEVDGQRPLAGSSGGGVAPRRLEERHLPRDLRHSPVEHPRAYRLPLVPAPVPLGPPRRSGRGSCGRPRAAEAEGEGRGGGGLRARVREERGRRGGREEPHRHGAAELKCTPLEGSEARLWEGRGGWTNLRNCPRGCGAVNAVRGAAGVEAGGRDGGAAGGSRRTTLAQEAPVRTAVTDKWGMVGPGGRTGNRFDILSGRVAYFCSGRRFSFCFLRFSV